MTLVPVDLYALVLKFFDCLTTALARILALGKRRRRSYLFDQFVKPID